MLKRGHWNYDMALIKNFYESKTVQALPQKNH